MVSNYYYFNNIRWNYWIYIKYLKRITYETFN